ncbi:hypothetical protein LOZ58_005121 [Ophidiomyces ophidiicola]|nr:hypothetical protein LOZ65_005048 [Ophidiomyces ophidiicola]KAI1958389.1 hypothetical protein LOZ58_005121 [Ophidiomyces ophidiicola]
MAPMDDLKAHAASSQDFYGLLGISSAAADTEIRRAYRKTALKYHPDKLQNPTPADIDKFHLLQIAYDVLSEPSVRQLYDNAREARERKKRENEMLEGVRRKMKEDLEARERGMKRPFGATGLDATVDLDKAEAILELEIKRLAEDGRRRRQQKEELMRREILEEEERLEQAKEEKKRSDDADKTSREPSGGISVAEIDRTVKVRWVREGAGLSLDKARLESLFSAFGKVESVFTLKNKKQPSGKKKERKIIATGVVVFSSIVGAHAAVEDSNRKNGEEWDIIDSVSWASNKEPDLESHRTRLPVQVEPTTVSPETASSTTIKSSAVKFPGLNSSPKPTSGDRKPPSFTSFSTPNTSSDAGSNLGPNSPSLEEITLIRLKNAEKKRTERLVKEGKERTPANPTI